MLVRWFKVSPTDLSSRFQHFCKRAHKCIIDIDGWRHNNWKIRTITEHAGFLDCRMWDEHFELFLNHYRVIRTMLEDLADPTSP
jgi:hypothetical protein